MKKIVGFMDNYSEAENLVTNLKGEGFKLENIEIVESSGRGVREKKSETGFIDSLKELFGMQESEEVRGYYTEGVRRGGAVVSVSVDDHDADRVVESMSRHGVVDIEQKAEEWKKSGWSGFDESSHAHASEATNREKKVLPVTEEEIEVGKRKVPKGKVRVYSHVTETPVEEDVRLREEHAKIERRPVDRKATSAEEGAFREQSFEVRETKEEPVVTKKARVKEEVVIGKDIFERTETVHDKVRRTEVEVENEGFDRYYNSISGKKEGDYAEYRAAYDHGGNLSRDTRYAGKAWFEVEDDVRRDWESRHPGTWEKYKDTIRHRWERRH